MAYRIDVKSSTGWAGRPPNPYYWEPAVSGTINQTGLPDEEASTFDTIDAARFFCDRIERNEGDRISIVDLDTQDREIRMPRKNKANRIG